MNTVIVPFDYDSKPIRTVLINGEPWFVLADLCAVLEIRNVKDVRDRLPDGVDQTYPIADGMGRTQQTTIVNEQGMYEVVFRSDKPEAVTFRRWITGTVLPQIRRTGSFGIIEIPTDYPSALRAAAEQADRAIAAEAALAVAAPKADAFNGFLGTTGDYSVNDAAKMLSRNDGILTGQGRLFDFMEAIGWIYRDARRKAIPYQAQIDTGRLVAKAQWHFHPETGERVADAPQVRVTAKGLEALRTRYLTPAVTA